MSAIGLIGDYNAQVKAHQAIPLALELAADSLGAQKIQTEWLPTNTLEVDLEKRLRAFQGLWCVPASPYASTEGALIAIRFARERAIPFLGTCGGFQHALLEYARNVLGMRDAAHAELVPEAPSPLISLLACSLVEKQDRIFLQEGSRTRQIYGRATITEEYRCRFGLNRAYEAKLSEGRLHFTGRDETGEVRVLELEGHPFFMGTLFQPERTALRGESHPLIRAFVEAVVGA